MTDTFNIVKLEKELIRDEGRKTKPYRDSEGILTIGVGWNLEEWGLPDHIIDQLTKISINRAISDAKHVIPSFEYLHPARQRVLVNMAFNLGRKRLGGFKLMRRAIAKRNWKEAAREMLDSKWARQVGRRATRLAEVMESDL